MSKPVDYLGCLSHPHQAQEWVKGKFLKGYAQTRIAFVGRSNVGKSSLINEILSQKVAWVSKTPGKTQKVHFFLDHEYNKIWVDLPGYGFAKKSKDIQEDWIRLVESYIKLDDHIGLIFILWDSKVAPTALDLDAFFYLRDQLQRPVFLIMTKLDQLKNQSIKKERAKTLNELLTKFGYPAEELLWISSHKKTGIKQLIKLIKEIK